MTMSAIKWFECAPTTIAADQWINERIELFTRNTEQSIEGMWHVTNVRAAALKQRSRAAFVCVCVSVIYRYISHVHRWILADSRCAYVCLPLSGDGGL